MCKYLVTGNAGTGKSSVAWELHQRGYNAMDGDELKGIHSLMDKMTGELVDQPGPEGLARFTTIWRPEPLRNLIQAASEIFICGTVSNQDLFYPLFDKIFCLYLSSDILAERLGVRTNNPTGHDKEGRNYLLAINERVTSTIKNAGAIMVSATQPIEKVVDEILSYANEN